MQEEHAQDEINEGREVYAQWLLKRILAKQINGNLRYILLDDTTISESAEVISKSKVGGTLSLREIKSVLEKWQSELPEKVQVAREDSLAHQRDQVVDTLKQSLSKSRGSCK